MTALPSNIAQNTVKWILPIHDDILLIHFAPILNKDGEIAFRDHATWISEPLLTLPIKGPKVGSRTATVAIFDDETFSFGLHAYQRNQLPIGYPFEHVFCEDKKVWVVKNSFVSLSASQDSDPKCSPKMEGRDFVTGKKIKNTLPKFFASYLDPKLTAFLDSSFLIPLPKKSKANRLGMSEGQLGFFVQGSDDGTVRAIGIDGRQAKRSIYINEMGVPVCDIPRCMISKPEQAGFWTLVNRQGSEFMIDESSGEQIASLSDRMDSPGQLCIPPHPLFWNLYTVRCEITSRKLRAISRETASHLLDTARKEDRCNETLEDSAERILFPVLRTAISSLFQEAPESLQGGIAATCLKASNLANAVSTLLT